MENIVNRILNVSPSQKQPFSLYRDFVFPSPSQNEKSILIESWSTKENFANENSCCSISVIKNWQGQIIRNSYWNVNSYVPRSEVKNDSLSTYFIINRNVRIGRSMFHAKTTIVLQRFDYLWTLCVFVDVRVPTVYLSVGCWTETVAFPLSFLFFLFFPLFFSNFHNFFPVFFPYLVHRKEKSSTSLLIPRNVTFGGG